MTRAGFLLLLCAAASAAAPAAAWDGVTVTEAAGQLHQHVNVAPSPTPGYCYWDHAPAPGPIPPATNADGYGNMDCPDPWFVRGDADSLVFRGTWPRIETEYVTGAEYVVDLACLVNVTADTRLRALRQVTAGALDTDEHTVSVEYPDGSVVPILAAGAGPDQAQPVLLPGTYRVTLRVHAYRHRSFGEVIEPYRGEVLVAWEGAGSVAEQSTSWSSLKASYRRRTPAHRTDRVRW